jgi:hypothetical protein
MKFVNHETYNVIVDLSHHTNTVTLAKATNKVILGPGKLKASLFDIQDRGHVATNHPAYMDARCVLFYIFHAGLLPHQHRFSTALPSSTAVMLINCARQAKTN